ncbi:MAG: GGDEF domain-containing protein [Rhodanobacteraceae bacterium]|nr:GGDEF domain-containing protein [Rhodanobacteraceae bacterium]
MLDMRTMMFIAAGTTALLALCLAAMLGRYVAPVGSSALLWARAIALQSSAWLAFSLGGVIPDLLSVLAGSLLMGLAYAECPRALHAFHSNDSRWLTPHWIAMGIAVPVAFYTWVAPCVLLRVVATSTVVMCLLLIAARETARAAPRPWPISHRIILAVFLGGAVVMLVRIVFEALAAASVSSSVATAPLQMITIGYMSLLPVVATFGFVMMCSEYARAEVEKLANTDPLTGAFNRRKFEQLACEQVSVALRCKQPVSLLLIDVDRFKRTNDLHGHEVGDRVLQNLVACSRHHLRPGDLIGRLGGEEFLVLLRDADRGVAIEIAERLRIAVATLDLRTCGERLDLSVSIGVATLSEHGNEFAVLVRSADRAMYLAKRRGRNRVVAADAEVAQIFDREAALTVQEQHSRETPNYGLKLAMVMSGVDRFTAKHGIEPRNPRSERHALGSVSSRSLPWR